MAWFLQNNVHERWAWTDLFTPDECSQIIKMGLEDKVVNAYVGEDREAKNSIRKGSVSWLDEKEEKYSWIYRKCTDAVNHLNHKYFGYDLTFLETLQFTIYDKEKDFYGKHVDNMYRGHGCRKLSFSVQLSDEKTYEGGELHLHYENQPVIVNKKIGTLNIFSSMILHEVTPMTSGTRYSLVGWVHGPNFK